MTIHCICLDFARFYAHGDFNMPKTILRLKIRDSRSLLRYTLITLLILTSAALADENQFLLHLKDLKDPGSLAVKLQDTRAVVSNPIVAQLSAETQRLLDEYERMKPLEEEYRQKFQEQTDKLD